MDNFRDSYFQVDWDLTSKRLKGTYWGKQYDTGRGFTVTVINGGQVVAPTTEVLRLKWEKPDNTTGYVNATIVNGKFVIENIDQMFTVHGSVRADFELSVGGEFVASITFYVNVEKAVAVDAVESSSDFTALQVAIATTDSITAQLAQMAKQSDVRFRTVKLDPEDLSPETLGLITGTGTVELLSDPHINSVSHEKTNFIETGKNLFDKTKRVVGYWVNYSTGGLVASEPYDTSDYIFVRGGTTYHLTKFRNYALYDIKKNYLSGFNNTTYGSETFTPAQDGYIRFATGNQYIDNTQLEVGSIDTNYEEYSNSFPNLILNDKNISNQIIGNRSIKNEAINDEKIDPTSSIVLKKPVKNLIDISKIINGYYVNYSNGELVASGNHGYTDYVKIEPNTKYTYSQLTNLQQFAYYDENQKYISGWSVSAQKSVTVTTPPNAMYVRFTIVLADINQNIQFELGSTATSYEPYSAKIPFSDLSLPDLKVTTIITVKQDGSGDFTNLRTATESITNASKDNPYIIEIHEGIYDVFADYTAEEINDINFIGLIKDNYVSFKGVGDKSKIVLKGEFPYEDDVILYNSKTRISTLCTFGNGNLENLTVTALYMRYAVHDDYNFTGAKMYVKNCVFNHLKLLDRNLGGKQAWGEGTRSGQERVFEDCTFISEWDYPAYTTHNTNGLINPSYHKFINCKFTSKLGEHSIRFSSLDGQPEIVDMIGCKNNAGILLAPTSPFTGVKHILKGYGNDVVPVKFDNTDGVQHVYEFVGETIEMFNNTGSVLAKGKPVALDENGTSILPMDSTMPSTRFYGVVMKDIPANDYGIVRIGGYLPIADTGLTTNIGDKIGVVNGNLAVVTTGDYVGVVSLTHYIKLN